MFYINSVLDMRHTSFKKIHLILISAVLLFGFGFAENDCELAMSWARVRPSLWSVYSWVISYPDLSVAYDNLYAYCCKETLFPEGQWNCILAPQKVYLESPYLFDHLIDVGFRRLEVVGAYSGQIIDTWAKAWYDFLHPSTWTLALTPLMVQEQYKNQWSLTHIPLLQDEAGDLKNYLPLYTGFSLRDKYYNLCYVVKNAYQRVLQWDPKKWPMDIWNQYNPSSLYSTCMSLAEQKVSRELTFTQTLMVERSSSTLETTMQSYTMTSFVKDRLMILMDKLKSVVALFEKITKQAPLSKRCAK